MIIGTNILQHIQLRHTHAILSPHWSYFFNIILPFAFRCNTFSFLKCCSFYGKKVITQSAFTCCSRTCLALKKNRFLQTKNWGLLKKVSFSREVTGKFSLCDVNNFLLFQSMCTTNIWDISVLFIWNTKPINIFYILKYIVAGLKKSEENFLHYTKNEFIH